jgi:hypothetical protein
MVTVMPGCDVCGSASNGARPLRDEERRAWRVAAWITTVCGDCRRGFRRRHPEKAAA